MFFLHYVKSAVENEFEIRFIQFDLFRRKSAFSTQFPLPVKTKARSRGVTMELKYCVTRSLLELV